MQLPWLDPERTRESQLAPLLERKYFVLTLKFCYKARLALLTRSRVAAPAQKPSSASRFDRSSKSSQDGVAVWEKEDPSR